MYRALSALLMLGLLGCGTEILPDSELAQVRKEGRQGQGRQGQGRQGQGAEIRIAKVPINPMFAGATYTWGNPTTYGGTAQVISLSLVNSEFRAVARIPDRVNTTGGSGSITYTNQTLTSGGVVGVEFMAETDSGMKRLKVVKHKMDTDPNVNLMQPGYSKIGGASVNAYEVHLYELMYQDGGVWKNLCQSSSDPVAHNSAMFFKGYWRWTTEADTLPNPARDGQYQDNPNMLSVGCWDGTAVKCARWGYFPWKSLTHLGSWIPLKDLHLACTRAAMADYCGNGLSHTWDGTIVDVSDRYGFIRPVSEETDNTDYIFSEEALFTKEGSPCLARERYYELGAKCPNKEISLNPADYLNCPSTLNPLRTKMTTSLRIDNNPQCSPTTVTIKAYQRGKLSSCTTNQDKPWLIKISNQTQTCSHSPFVTGGSSATVAGRALAIDCNYCSQKVCGTNTWAGDGNMPSCCALDANGYPAQNAWTPACVAKAKQICKLSLPVDPNPG